MHTTGMIPDFLMVLTWWNRFSQPFSSSSRFSSVYSLGRGRPATTVGPPPCIFRARMVATSTDTLGVRPLRRAFTFQNFSKPMSAAKPDSVTW